jgi:hypothetical protein
MPLFGARMEVARSRKTYLVLLATTVALGLASRRWSFLLPWWLAKNAGDILYATMSFWIGCLLVPRRPAVGIGVGAMAFCLAIECLKLLDWPWMANVRHNPFGHLIFGTGFQPTNLICYAVGVALALLIERLGRPGRGSQSGGSRVEEATARNSRARHSGE